MSNKIEEQAEGGYWHKGEGYLPQRHRCNEKCRVHELIHFVLRKELSTLLASKPLANEEMSTLRTQIRIHMNNSFQYGEQGMTDVDTINAALDIETESVLRIIAEDQESLRESVGYEYEDYRFVLDAIYNAGATHKDHSKLKDEVDKYIHSFLAKQKENWEKEAIKEGQQRQWNKTWDKWLELDDGRFDEWLRSDNKELWMDGDTHLSSKEQKGTQ